MFGMFGFFLLWNKSKVRAMEEISPLSWLSCSTGIMPLAWDGLIGTQENHFTSELMQVVSKTQHCWPLFSVFRPHISFSVSPYSFATLHTNRPMKWSSYVSYQVNRDLILTLGMYKHDHALFSGSRSLVHNILFSSTKFNYNLCEIQMLHKPKVGWGHFRLQTTHKNSYGVEDVHSHPSPNQAGASCATQGWEIP